MLKLFWQVLTSTLAAFFGVQSDKNRQRDFQMSSPVPFIVMGIVLAALLVLTLILIVRFVID
ncbi:DUF2970 domain-containing protein [Parashewanella tropica]|uniref:DUF2970 domain-containing protein n=1 Tax=Parashewanella tropica TaxID=2547970 RepID=UPI00105A43CD|nr:DUF2970 domain-containing protein [Parashewanella tropica]